MVARKLVPLEVGLVAKVESGEGDAAVLFVASNDGRWLTHQLPGLLGDFFTRDEFCLVSHCDSTETVGSLIIVGKISCRSERGEVLDARVTIMEPNRATIDLGRVIVASPVSYELASGFSGEVSFFLRKFRSFGNGRTGTQKQCESKEKRSSGSSE